MTAYTSIFNTPPSGSNYLIGDTVTLTGGDVWKYAGNGQWVATGADVVTFDPGKESVALTATISDGENRFFGIQPNEPTLTLMPTVYDIETSDLAYVAGSATTLTLPNPYPSQANAPVHLGPYVSPTKWRGYKFWLAFTPYPGNNSVYENPCIIKSNDLVNWTGLQILAAKPAGGYNADTHLFMAPDESVLYLAYREKVDAAQNRVFVTSTADGDNWTKPVSVISGAAGVQDFACPSIFWEPSIGRWVMISHNLDAAAPWPVERRVSLTANIYDGFDVAQTVTIPPKSGRAWWHSYFLRLPSGRIVAAVQDNQQSPGSSGYVYFAESRDGGLTLTIKNRWWKRKGLYRPALAAQYTAYGPQLLFIDCDLTNKVNIAHALRPGARVNASIMQSRIAGAIAQGANRLPQTLFADSFVRADTSAGLGTSSSGQAWVASSGTWGISGNRAYAVSTGRVLFDTTVESYLVEVEINAIAGEAWLIARAANGSNYYRIGVALPLDTDGMYVLRMQKISGGNAAGTVLVGHVVPGDIIGVESDSHDLRIYLNGQCIHVENTQFNVGASQVGLQADAGATYFRNFAVTRI